MQDEIVQSGDTKGFRANNETAKKINSARALNMSITEFVTKCIMNSGDFVVAEERKRLAKEIRRGE